MKKNVSIVNIRIQICLLLLSLFLSGCGRVDSEGISRFVTEPYSENPENPRPTSKQPKESESKEQEKEEASKIMKHIIHDTGFRLSAYVDAEIEKDDSAEIIYQKLEQCKILTLDRREFQVLCKLKN